VPVHRPAVSQGTVSKDRDGVLVGAPSRCASDRHRAQRLDVFVTSADVLMQVPSCDLDNLEIGIDDRRG
jgi:hypothetical protein